MSKEEDKARLRDLIQTQEHEIEALEDRLALAQLELVDLESELQALERG